MKGLITLCVIAVSFLWHGSARADNRPVFWGELGESDEALQVWGGKAVRDIYRTVVFRDFSSTDKEIVVVIWWPLLEWAEECEWTVAKRKPALIWVKNPGWHGFKGDRAKVEMLEEMHLIQLYTKAVP